MRKESKRENREMESIIQHFKERGIKVKAKNGYGNPSSPYWSASMGKKQCSHLHIK